MFQHENAQEWRLVAVRVFIMLALSFLVSLLSTLFFRKDMSKNKGPTPQNQASSSLSR